MKYDLELIRSRVTIRDVLEINGCDFGSAKRGVSPLRHDADNRQAFDISRDERYWYDFVEGKGGDVFALQMRLTGHSFIEAAGRLAKFAGGATTESSKEWKSPARLKAEQADTHDAYRVQWHRVIQLCDERRVALIAADEAGRQLQAMKPC